MGPGKLSQWTQTSSHSLSLSPSFLSSHLACSPQCTEHGGGGSPLGQSQNKSWQGLAAEEGKHGQIEAFCHR